MKKIISIIFLLSCVLTISAQMSHPVMIWQDGNKMTLDNVDSITFVQTPNVAESEFVDLGLSVKWAKCNIGATTESAYGNYYAWGETATKTNYTWGTYKYANGDESSTNSNRIITKYVKNGDYSGYNNFYDDKYILDSGDDAATVLKGTAYRMPTYDEYLELVDNCTFAIETVNNHKGMRITGPNGNSIFLPMAGSRDSQERSGTGDHGYYWTSQGENGTAKAMYIVYYNENSLQIRETDRKLGCNIRPVLP